MTAAEQKKVKILAVVLVLAGITWYFVLRGESAGTAVAPPQPAPAATKTAASTKAPKLIGDGVIHMELLNQLESDADAGDTNLFQYRPPPEPVRTVATLPQHVPPAASLPTSGSQMPPAPPPPPPFKAFRYEAVVRGSATGKLTAFLSDGTGSPAFAVEEGHTFLGIYKVTRLTETMVEVEDLTQKGRRQTFPKVLQ
jgi:hypothetical protein